MRTDWRPASARICTSWDYSDWDRCSSGQQTRTIVAAYPAGCTGGSPILTQNCSSGGGDLSFLSVKQPQPPFGGFKILINDNAEDTGTRNVTLQLNGGPDTVRMSIANNSDFLGIGSTGQIPYQTTYVWDICKGIADCAEKTYTVYARFYNDMGNWSETVADNIVYLVEKKETPEVIVKEEPKVCAPYVTKFIGRGVANDPAEIKKVQQFLKNFEGQNSLIISGSYDQATVEAVIKFQEKYAQDILIPWGLNKGTGNIFKTTIAKINEIYCGAVKEPLSVVTELTCPYFTQYLQSGNSGLEVVKVKKFLSELGFYQGNVSSGVYDNALTDAINQFQLKYAEDILRPWELTAPTGFWYKTTIKKANELKGCKN